MSKVRWLDPPIPTNQSCIVCGNKQHNQIVLNTDHWHADYEQLEVAFCGQCQSAFTLNAREMIAPYPSAETALQDPDFIYLIYHYLELASGLDWKLPLLERLPFHCFNSVLEIGCNVGVTLDYCDTVWGVDVVGLEPSAYGVKGAQLLNLPIINAYTHEAEELRNKRFSFIYATEVMEHVLDPLAFLKEMHAYLEPGGVLLITTPSSSALHKNTLPGELYAALSPGAHYFLLSQKQLKRLAQQAGFKHIEIKLLYQTNIAYLSDSPVTFEADPIVESRLTAYHAAKITQRERLDKRVYLGHLINNYICAIKSKTPLDEVSLSNEIDKELQRQFSLSLDAPLELAERIAQAQSIFDFGKIIPYALPSYLYHRAEHIKGVNTATNHDFALAALLSAKGLQIDFTNLFLYNQTLRLSQKQMASIPATLHKKNHTEQQLRSMIDTITAQIPELNEKPLTPLLRIKRKLRTLRNEWLPK